MTRAQVEALLDELLGGWPWRSWDAALSALLDQAVVAEEAQRIASLIPDIAR